jgi:hypothetical protein
LRKETLGWLGIEFALGALIGLACLTFSYIGPKGLLGFLLVAFTVICSVLFAQLAFEFLLFLSGETNPLIEENLSTLRGPGL